MTMWVTPLVMRVARPIARGRHLRLCLFGPLSAVALLTKSASTSVPGDCWRALATALSSSLAMTGAPDFVVNWRSCRASLALRPRTRSTIMRAFLGLMRANLALAWLIIPMTLWRLTTLGRRDTRPDRSPFRRASGGLSRVPLREGRGRWPLARVAGEGPRPNVEEVAKGRTSLRKARVHLP